MTSKAERELKPGKGKAMMGGHAQLVDRGTMLGGAIPHVPLPTVAGIAQRKTPHESIANHLRDDRRARDRMDLCVSTNDRVVFTTEVLDGKTVDHDMTG